MVSTSFSQNPVDSNMVTPHTSDGFESVNVLLSNLAYICRSNIKCEDHIYAAVSWVATLHGTQ